MTLLELYESQAGDGDIGENSRALLEQAHWFTVNADFDPRTGEALPQALSAFLARIGRPAKREAHHDRLWRITEHSRPSVERLFRTLIENPRREHALLPVRAVREVDANSFIKLSNRPGRNIREKLAAKPYLHAVRRFQSVNLPENRLLKAFVTRLAEMLVLRQDCLGELEDELLPKIQSWLLSDEAQQIAGWNNLPPNNTLLSHRDYRTIWDAWRWLQTLDEDITRDFSQLEGRSRTMRLWKEYGRMYSDGAHRLAEMPVLFDYEKFEIRPWVSERSDKCLCLPPHAVQKAPQRIARLRNAKEVPDPVCVDLAALRPRYATTKAPARNLQDAYFWQDWKNNDEAVEIGLFNSDAFYLHPDATSVSLIDLLYSKDLTGDHHERAARAFAGKLRSRFTSPTLLWLVPDFLNDFNLEIIRRNLNACFTHAEPLPRSVAAVFDRIDYSKIKNDDYSVVVVDTIGGHTCVTKLIARCDPKLKRRLPETNGFFWERCPTVIVSRGEPESAYRRKYDAITVDSKGRWQDAVPPDRPPFFDPSALKSDPRIGEFNYCINLAESPVAGGIRLHSLQQRAGDIPLWHDRIPELSIKVMKAGCYERFFLVSRGRPVKPIRGQAVTIPIREHFTLPAGKRFYQFPLFQGENAEDLGVSARLESPAFPLKTDAGCKLKLTFEYGADEPYKLIFEPTDTTLPSMRVTWRPAEDVIITDAPAPGYPAPITWEVLRRWPKPGSNEKSDLLEWVLTAIDRLDKDMGWFLRPQERSIGKIITHWDVDRNGKRFTRSYCDEYSSDVFIYESTLVQGLRTEDFAVGDNVSFELEAHNGRFFGRRVAKVRYIKRAWHAALDENAIKGLQTSIRKRLYVPFIQIWRDGRSITDKECPEHFADSAKVKVQFLRDLLSQAEIPRLVKREILFLLACLHKDTTDDCIQWITEQVESGNIDDPRAIGFALGDVSDRWQQYIFSILASKPDLPALSIFAYAIWREHHFIERFTPSELSATLKALSRRLTKISSIEPNGPDMKDIWTCRDWVRATTETLELLLGLLRARASTDPEIKMLLQPHQNITKKLARQVELVTEIITKSNVLLFSRVQLNLQKTPGDRTPDLLYALRLYLTGDVGADAIHITSVSDSDND